MLYCKYCDYFKALTNNSDQTDVKIYVCEFTNITFNGDVESFNMEHPCNYVNMAW